MQGLRGCLKYVKIQETLRIATKNRKSLLLSKTLFMTKISSKSESTWESSKLLSKMDITPPLFTSLIGFLCKAKVYMLC